MQEAKRYDVDNVRRGERGKDIGERGRDVGERGRDVGEEEAGGNGVACKKVGRALSYTIEC